jgi:hypothetical protein
MVFQALFLEIVEQVRFVSEELSWFIAASSALSVSGRMGVTIVFFVELTLGSSTISSMPKATEYLSRSVADEALETQIVTTREHMTDDTVAFSILSNVNERFKQEKHAEIVITATKLGL